MASTYCTSCSCNSMNTVSCTEQVDSDSIISAYQTKHKNHSRLGSTNCEGGTDLVPNNAPVFLDIIWYYIYIDIILMIFENYHMKISYDN